MAAGKNFPLSITVKTVDRATSGIKRINAELERAAAPLKNLRSEFGKLAQNAGLPKITGGLRGIGSVLKDVAVKAGLVAGAIGGAAFVFKGMVDHFDDLGAAASRIGLTVDSLAQLRFAAEKSDIEVEELDAAMGTFTKGLGQASAKTGKLFGFLGKVSPALRKQVVGAKSSEEAFGLMADAIAKIKDPTRRAALATAAFGGAGIKMVPLLARGSAGVAELKKRYLDLAGSQKGAADGAGDLDDAMKDVHAAGDGVKAAIVEGLAPALTDLAKSAGEFLSSHREQIRAWAKDFGQKLPGILREVKNAFIAVRDALAPVVHALGWLVDAVGGGEHAVKLFIGAWLGFKALQLVGHLGSIASGVMGVVGALGKMAGVGGAGGMLDGVGKGFLALLGPIGLVAGAVAGLTTAGVLFNRQLTGWLDKQGLHGVAEAFRGGSGSSSIDFFIPEKRAARRRAKRAAAARAQLTSEGRFLPTLSGRPQMITDGVSLDRALGPSGRTESQQAKVTLEIKNAPPGSRVKSDPRNTADVDLDVGYQLDWGTGGTR